MMRPWLTDGNVDFVTSFHEAVQAHFDHPAKEQKRQDESLEYRRKLANVVHTYRDLQNLGLTKPIPDRIVTLDKGGDRIDKSMFSEPSPFQSVITEDVVACFGRAGSGAVASVAEAMMTVNALARPFGAAKIYYRGEHNYGWELKSRAQRKLEESGDLPDEVNGITDRELDELRRFQDQVHTDPDLELELVRYGTLPASDDPEWLPIMQHYDPEFGSRMLDISSSVFAGLHFACVDWDGRIDFETDGLLYVFFDHGRYYKSEHTGDFDDEISEFLPVKITDSFKNWRCPEYLHHYRSAQYSMREFAQDGYFLVQSDLALEPVFGGRGKFKLCIPHWAKARIISELWFAVYTPERIVRGKIGKLAGQRAKKDLEEYLENHPGW